MPLRPARSLSVTFSSPGASNDKADQDTTTMTQPTTTIGRSPAGPWLRDARDDDALVLAVRAGDPSAFEAIMRRHNRLLFRTARGIVDDDAEAQDVVQDAYLRAFTSIASFRGQSALATWLARIVINGALSAQRRKGRVIRMSEEDEFMDAVDGRDDASSGETPDSAATPEQAAAEAQMAARLREAIDRLPAIYRSVFMLRAVEEMSVEDTAAVLSVRTDVVKTRYLRVRAMLREDLRADVGVDVRQAHAFAGERCDAVVATVLAHLRARGLIRAH